MIVDLFSSFSGFRDIDQGEKRVQLFIAQQTTAVRLPQLARHS